MRVFAIVLILLFATPAIAQNTVSLNTGDPAPAPGRWIEEKAFALWWNDYHRLKGEIVSLEGRLKDAQARRVQMTAMLGQSEDLVKAQQISITALQLEKEQMLRERDKLFTGWEVLKYSAGASAATIVIFLLIRGASS